MQADCVLLVAPEGASCDVTAAEYETVWQKMMPRHVPLTPANRASSSLSRLPQQDGGSKSKLCRMDMAALATMDSTTGAAFTAESDNDSDVCTQPPFPRRCNFMQPHCLMYCGCGHMLW